MASSVSFDDDIERAIQLSIQDLSFEQQFRIAQQRSERESSRRQTAATEMGQMSFEEQLRLAEEMSLRDARNASRPFTTELFDELDLQTSDGDFKMALKRSEDPSEQNSEEMRDILLAMKMSESVRSSLELYNGTMLTDSALSPEEIESLRPYLELNDGDEALSSVSSDAMKTKTKDEIEVEPTQVEQKKKNKRKKKKLSTPANSIPDSPSPSDWTLVTRKAETGARPKKILKVANQSSSPQATRASCSDSRQSGSARRPIIVDGNNVAYQHGKNDRFSAKGLQIVFDYFCDKFGYSIQDFFIVHKPGGHKSPADSEIIESLYKMDVLIKTVLLASCYTLSSQAGGCISW